MELKTESMKNMKKTVEKCLDELMKKNDLTPAETKAAIDGFHLYDELCCRIEECEAEEEKKDPGAYAERGYSMHGEPYRQYHITSYGMPERAVYSDRSYGHMNRGSYSSGPQYGVHGWYESNRYPSYPGYPSEHMNASYCDDPYYYGPEYSDRGHGYSRHSISDRAVSSLEKLFDMAASEYEKQELKKYISMIRAAGMSD
jgi:hypothetical protein